MIKLKDGSMVPSMLFAANPSSSTTNTSLQAAANSNRRNLLNTLKQAQIQKRSANLTLDKIKETFQTTELDEEKSKSIKKPQLDLGETQPEVANPQQIMSLDEEDSEYQEGDDELMDEEEEEEAEAVEGWDDDENLVMRPKGRRGQVQGEEEPEQEQEELEDSQELRRMKRKGIQSDQDEADSEAERARLEKRRREKAKKEK